MDKATFHLETIKEEHNAAVYAVYPLPRGFGHTMGNVLRRVLLSSLTGAAVTYVAIKGVNHPFVTVKGMKEDVLTLLLNLKRLRFQFETSGEQKLTLKKKGKAVITAADIEDSSLCKVVNKDLYLCELASDGALEIEMWVNKGAGYEPSEEKEQREYGMLALDSVFTPVTNVSVKVEGTRVGRKTNFDKLILSVATDGSVAPRQAVNEAGSILVDYFKLFVEGGTELPAQETNASGSALRGNSKDEGDMMMVDELDLPTRVINALLKYGVETVNQLSAMTDEDFSKVRGLGKKSIEELKVKLQELKTA